VVGETSRTVKDKERKVISLPAIREDLLIQTFHLACSKVNEPHNPQEKARGQTGKHQASLERKAGSRLFNNTLQVAVSDPANPLWNNC